MEKSQNQPGKWRQYIATMIEILVNLAPFLSGVAYGWCSTMIPHLSKKGTPVGTEPLTTIEASWLISGLAIGPFIVCPFCGSFCERFGRKATGLLIAFPFTVCWLLILFATNFYHLLIAQILNGAASAIASFFVPLYVIEIASDDIRGQLGSFFLFSIKIGLLLSYIVGTMLSYRLFAMCALIMPICHFGGLLWLPETPLYLIRKHRIDEATRSLMWLRGYDKSAVDLELSRLEAFVNDKTGITKSANIKDLFTVRANLKGLIIAVMLALGQQSCGINIMVTSTVTVFKLAKSSIDPYIAAIIFGVMQVFGSGLSTLTMDRVGRRPLLLLSSSGMAGCHCVLGIFLLIQSLNYDVSGFSWLPVGVLSIFSVFYCTGVGPITHVVPNEVYNPDLASVCNGITLFMMTCCNVLVVQLFPITVLAIGLPYCFFIFLICCMCTFAFVFFYVPETRGKSRDSILKKLKGPTRKSEKARENIVIQSAAINM